MIQACVWDAAGQMLCQEGYSRIHDHYIGAGQTNGENLIPEPLGTLGESRFSRVHQVPKENTEPLPFCGRGSSSVKMSASAPRRFANLPVSNGSCPKRDPYTDMVKFRSSLLQ